MTFSTDPDQEGGYLGNGGRRGGLQGRAERGKRRTISSSGKRGGGLDTWSRHRRDGDYLTKEGSHSPFTIKNQNVMAGRGYPPVKDLQMRAGKTENRSGVKRFPQKSGR